MSPKLYLVCIAAMAGVSMPVYAQPIIFDTPDYVIPNRHGDGLIGAIYTDIDVDTLADARVFVDNNTANATFRAGTVNFPQGSQDTLSVPGSNFGDLLGGNVVTLFPDISNVEINNSIIRFEGYFANYIANTVFTFNLGSDDGSELRIQNNSIIQNDGIHSFPGASGPVEVQFGAVGLYDIEILFFESEPNDYGIEWTMLNNSSGDFIGVNQALLFTSQIPEPNILALLTIGMLSGFYYTRQSRIQLKKLYTV